MIRKRFSGIVSNQKDRPGSPTIVFRPKELTWDMKTGKVVIVDYELHAKTFDDIVAVKIQSGRGLTGFTDGIFVDKQRDKFGASFRRGFGWVYAERHVWEKTDKYWIEVYQTRSPI